MKRNPVVIVIVAILVSFMLALGIRMARRGPHASLGQAAPDFTLRALDGKTLRLSDFRGKAVLLNFWATWCEPCKIEMPWFIEFQKQYAAQGLQVIGVAMDDSSPAEIAKFAKEMNVNYPILTGSDSEQDSIGSAYGGIQGLPETFLIDRNGKVTDKILGLEGRAEVEDTIKKALAAGNSGQ